VKCEPSAGGLRTLTTLRLRDHISQQIVNAILDGTFKPGDRLIETTISEELGVSRAPVREALMTLEGEGIVVNTPRRGYTVLEFTEKDIDDIYSLRLILEAGALRRAIDRFTAEDIATLERIVADLGKNAQESASSETMVALDFAFHELICRVAHHGRLLNAWNSMRLQTLLLISITSPTHRGDPHQPQELHKLILNAIRSHDLEHAEQALAAHISDAQQRARNALAERAAFDSHANPDRLAAHYGT
jgi:DNA-binding GntR family transcriptional regulator